MESPWAIIEGAPDAAAALTWKRWLGPAFDAVAALCLRDTKRKVKWVPCENGCECNHRVRKAEKHLWDRMTSEQKAALPDVHQWDELLVGRCECDENCEDILLTMADVKVWKFDLPKLARSVAKALDCFAVAKPFGPPRTVQLAALGNPAVLVMLTVQPDAESYHNAVAHLAAKLPKGFILLTPTKLTDVATLEMVTRANVGFYDMESNLVLTQSGNLSSTKTAAVLFAQNLPEKSDAVKESDAVRIFAILQKLQSKRAGMKAPLYDVFMATVVDGLSQRAAAKKCGCSPAQMSKRAGELKKEFGLPLKQLQNYIKPILEMQTSVKGDRRRKRKPGSGPGAFADDNPDDNGDNAAPKEEYRYEESDKDD